MTNQTENLESLKIELLNAKSTQKDVIAKVNEMIEFINNMKPTRDRGPKSERPMTESDARAVMIGELKDLSHKSAAEKLNLSYGQVYSARNGYTFKTIYQEMIKSKK